MRGGREGIGGVFGGLDVGRTKRGFAYEVMSLGGTAEWSSSSVVGYGGVVGGGDGEEESEEMTTASAGFGRRRFDVGCVGRANGCLSFSKLSGSSS